MATNTTPRPTSSASTASTGESARFRGQPFVLSTRLNNAVEELRFYKGYGRHRNERETSDVRTHTQWKADAMELCLALRDAIAQGLMEPETPKRDE